MGAVFSNRWIITEWNPEFMKNKNPSIEFLELFALAAAILASSSDSKNNRYIIFCHNQSVVDMVNNTNSSCKNCMTLMRHLVKEQLKHNFRVFARHVRTEDNVLADALSRGQLQRFWDNCEKLNKQMQSCPTSVPSLIWPLEKLWLD